MFPHYQIQALHLVKNITEMMLCSCHWMIQFDFFHFDHLNEMMSAMLLLYCKVILFPF